jgi:hypothetical protein
MIFLKALLLFLALEYFRRQVLQFIRGRASRGWPTIRGRVVRVSIDEGLLNRGQQNRESYSANVTYSYEIGGTPFQSSRFTFRPTTGLSENEVTRMLDGITTADEVDVYYDPNNWGEAVLLPGTSFDNALRLAFSLVALVLVGFYCVSDSTR